MAVDWDFSLLESLIQDRGDLVIHETAVACPCRKEDFFAGLIHHNGRLAKARTFYCPNCSNNGFLYRDARPVLGMITSVNSGNRSLIEFGRAEPGDLVFSPSLDAGRISDFDRITMTYPAPVDDGQQIMRNVANLGENQSKNLGMAADEDKMWYQANEAIWCEDENGIRYIQGSDFAFVEKKIKWIGNRPDDGTWYTIKYTAFLSWISYITQQTRFDQARNLAPKVVLKKEHVAFGNEKASTPAERKTLEANFEPE
jgi:hypothetical protein